MQTRTLAIAFVLLMIQFFRLEAQQSPTKTNRPMRKPHELVLTIGQNEGDLQGNTDKVIQAGIEYLDRLGGGTLRILPGVYDMNNFVHLRPNITLKGSGEETILRKTDGVVTPLVRNSDWYEWIQQALAPVVELCSGLRKPNGVMMYYGPLLRELKKISFIWISLLKKTFG